MVPSGLQDFDLKRYNVYLSAAEVLSDKGHKASCIFQGGTILAGRAETESLGGPKVVSFRLKQCSGGCRAAGQKNCTGIPAQA